MVFFISGVSASVTLSTCGGSSFDTKIQVFRETEEMFLICVGGNDDYWGLGTVTTFEAVSTETYRVLMTGYRYNEGSFQLSVECSSISDSDD